jgi:hypothetical protein
MTSLPFGLATMDKIWGWATLIFRDLNFNGYAKRPSKPLPDFILQLPGQKIEYRGR